MTSAVIVAGGSSRRMGFDKLRADLAGVPVLVRSLMAFEACPDVDEIILVTSQDTASWITDTGFEFLKVKKTVPGGSERHLSVWNGIQATSSEAKIILVHDAARPLVSVADISHCIETAVEYGGASLAHPISDTLKRANAANEVEDSLSRENLWGMETPQAFSADLLKAAYKSILAQNLIVTDEVSAFQVLGKKVKLVPSTSSNLKVTYPADVALASALLQLKEH